MTYSTEELNDAKSRAMIGLMATPDASFFTTLAFNMKYVWNENIPTACTDGTTIEFNPQWFMALTPPQRVGLLVHESCHVAYLHAERLDGRDHKKFNIAADHVINLQILDRGFQLPPNGYHDKQYVGMDTETVYGLLPNMDQVPFPMQDLKPATTQTPEQVRAEVEEILVRAAIQSKLDGDRPGTIPGELQLFLDGLLKPKLPWNRILQKWVQNLCKSDYTFRKPNRRFFPQHYLPTLFNEKLIDLVIAVDASASVSDAEFHQMVTEVASIFKMMKPDNITLIQFDMGIRSVTKLKSIRDLLQCVFTGRGGTDISELVTWVNEKKPKLTLVFTDGNFRFYNAEVKTPLTWLIHNNKGFTAPYGKVIHYELKP